MSTDSQAVSSCLAALRTLKRQFEAGAEKYPFLSNLLIVRPESMRSEPGTFYPVRGLESQRDFLYEAHGNGDFNFRWKKQPDLGGRIYKKPLGYSDPNYTLQRSIIYSSSKLRPDEAHLYSVGVELFNQHCSEAGEGLENLPAGLLNSVVPSELMARRDEVLADPVTVIREAFELDRLERSTDVLLDAMLPPGSTAGQRWINFLHWLSWSDNAPPTFKVERRTWAYFGGGISNCPWFHSREEHANWWYTRPSPNSDLIHAWPTFEGTRHYLSNFTNVFLRSALAIDAIEHMISSEGDSSCHARTVRAVGVESPEKPAASRERQAETKIAIDNPKPIRLTPTSLKIIKSLQILKSHDPESSNPIKKVLNQAKIASGVDSNNVKQSIKHLKSIDYIDSALGCNGGIWLTNSGRLEAERRKYN